MTELHLRPNEAGDLVSGLYRQLRDAVVLGRLRAGERLPPTRALAEQLGVSRSTVTEAYERLVAEGLAEGRVGAGTFVTQAAAGLARSPERRRATAALPPVRRAGPAPLPASPPVPAAVRYDLRIGRPDLRLFPAKEFRSLLVEQAGRVDRDRIPAETAGEPALRVAVASYLGRSRGLDVDPDDVVLTRGTGPSLDLLARALTDTRSTVVMESPGYPEAWTAFSRAGARIVGVPVDSDGLRAEALPRRARLLYCTPSHQSPLGPVMSLPRRVAVLDWARTAGAWIVEDDYDTEYRWAPRPLDPLRTLDPDGRVIYCGSVSKVLAPWVRIGWIVAPRSVRDAVVAVKDLTDPVNDRVPELALAAMLDRGLYSRHTSRASVHYRDRRERLLHAVARRLPDFDVVPGPAGLHITLLPRDGDADTPARLSDLTFWAADRGMALRTVGQVSVATDGGGRTGLVLGFGGLEGGLVDEAVALLRQGLVEGDST